MSVREYAKTGLFDFFVITTFVNIAIFVLGSVYRQGVTLSYDAFLTPPLYGLFGTIPGWILYSKKELTRKQIIIRKIFQVIFLEIILMLLTFPGDHFCMENMGEIISFAMSVLIIYILVHLITWIFDKKQAKIMMEDISNYQKQMMK